MRHQLFEVSSTGLYKVAVLSKFSAFNKAQLTTYYVDPLVNAGIPREDIIAFTLDYDSKGKAPVSFIKDYLNELLPELNELGTEYLYACDSAYFKILTKQTKADINAGYALPCAIKGYEHMRVILGVNYQQLIYTPDAIHNLNRGLAVITDCYNGCYVPPGTDIIHSAVYPVGASAIEAELTRLHSFPELAADIEAFSLRFNEAGVGTIGFAPDLHSGVAFACDYTEMPLPISGGLHGFMWPNLPVRALLKKFLEEYQGKLTWHNANYDLKVLIYTLWMKGYEDTEGLLEGLEVVTRLFDDTKLIAYLATNSCAGNVLGLKPLAQGFAGNWAQNAIVDIRKIPLKILLQYNLVDCLSTNFVKQKYYQVMIDDNQLDIYNEIMIPSVKTLLQTELTGMPMNIAKIKEARDYLEELAAGYAAQIEGTPLIQQMNTVVQRSAMEAANAKLKVKQHPLSHFSDLVFNPGSGQQLQYLLYELMGLPVIDLTDSKAPATGADTIEKLIHHTQNPEYVTLLNALIGHGKVAKILSTFIPAFEAGIIKAKDGIIWLHGSFNLGGTVSGRLSSSAPNLTNLPAGSKFGKLIKLCFMAPEGWLMGGADFASLEDRISALTTKDANKLKVYTGVVIYKIAIDGVTHHIRDDDTIEYDGQTYKGNEFYEKYRTI